MKDDGRYSRRVKIYHGGGYGAAKCTPDHWREVIVGYGFLVPEGAMPVFSVDTEEEAKALIVAACPLNYDGEYFSRELAQEQTLENLQAFSDKLAYCWPRVSLSLHLNRQNVMKLQCDRCGPCIKGLLCHRPQIRPGLNSAGV